MEVHRRERRGAVPRAQAVIARDHGNVFGHAPPKFLSRPDSAHGEGVHRRADGVDIGVLGQQALGFQIAGLLAPALVETADERRHPVRLCERPVGVFGLLIGVARLSADKQHDAAAERGLIKGERIGVDASTMEANAALRTIVRRDNGEGYRAMLTRMAKESGIETPTAEDLVWLDRKRKARSCRTPTGKPD